MVEATLAKFDSFHTTHKLSNFNGFLRRVAYVETKFGMDEDTFRDGYHGGIWQVGASTNAFCLLQIVCTKICMFSKYRWLIQESLNQY